MYEFVESNDMLGNLIFIYGKSEIINQIKNPVKDRVKSGTSMLMAVGDEGAVMIKFYSRLGSANLYFIINCLL